MRIDPTNASSVAPVATDKPAEGHVHHALRLLRAHLGGGELVELSAAGAAASSGAPTDPAKIASLKAAVQAGTYTPDTEKLANALVDEETSR